MAYSSGFVPRLLAALVCLSGAGYAFDAAAWGPAAPGALAAGGQNEAALFRAPCGETALIDAGEGAADDVSDQLAAWGTTGRTWAVASHYDADHIGDIADLTTPVPVLYDRGGGAAAKATATYDRYFAYAEARTHTAVDIGSVLTLCPGAEQVTFTVLSAGTDGTAADAARGGAQDRGGQGRRP